MFDVQTYRLYAGLINAIDYHTVLLDRRFVDRIFIRTF